MLADAQGWGDLAYSGNETKMRERYIYIYIYLQQIYSLFCTPEANTTL